MNDMNMGEKILLKRFILSILLSQRNFKMSVSLAFALMSATIQAAPSAPTAVTGQTTSFSPGDDGDYQIGVSAPNPRFVDNNDGTVTDRLSGLVWLKNAACLGSQDWSISLAVNGLADGACTLSDRSVAGDWRLPNVLELFSLIDLGRQFPALPLVHPFSGVVNDLYWTSTTLDNGLGRARTVNIGTGNIDQSDKVLSHYVWPVRDAN